MEAYDDPMLERDDRLDGGENAPAATNDEPGTSLVLFVAEPPTFAESFAAAEQAAFGVLVSEHGFRAGEREVGRDGSKRGVFGRVVYRSAASAEGASRQGRDVDRDSFRSSSSRSGAIVSVTCRDAPPADGAER